MTTTTFAAVTNETLTAHEQLQRIEMLNGERNDEYTDAFRRDEYTDELSELEHLVSPRAFPPQF